MLESVRIQGFRSCKDVELEVGTPLIALLGRNGAGKTNILKGIDWLARTSSSLEPTKPDVSFHGPSLTKASIRMSIDGSRYQFSRSRQTNFVEKAPLEPKISLIEDLSVFSSEGSGGWQPLFHRETEEIEVTNRPERYRVNAFSAALPSLAALLPPEDQLLRRIDGILSFFASIRYYSLEEPMDQSDGAEVFPFVLDEHYAQWRANGDVGNGSLHMLLLRLFLEDRALFDELKALVEPTGLGILQKLDVETMPLAARAPSSQERAIYILRIVPVDSGPTESFGYSELSAGTRRLMRLLLALLCDDSAVMLVEQPEDSIHPGLTSKLLDLLKSYSRDRAIIMTTHSTAMLNSLSPKEVRLVTMEDGRTSLRPLDDRELEAAKAFLENEGTLADFVETVQ